MNTKRSVLINLCTTLQGFIFSEHAQKHFTELDAMSMAQLLAYYEQLNKVFYDVM